MPVPKVLSMLPFEVCKPPKEGEGCTTIALVDNSVGLAIKRHAVSVPGEQEILLGVNGLNCQAH